MADKYAVLEAMRIKLDQLYRKDLPTYDKIRASPKKTPGMPSKKTGNYGIQFRRVIMRRVRSEALRYASMICMVGQILML